MNEPGCPPLNSVVRFLIPNVIKAVALLLFLKALMTLGTTVNIDAEGAIVRKGLSNSSEILKENRAVFENAVGKVKRHHHIAAETHGL